MPTKQIKDWTKIERCRHPEHRPPSMQVFNPGVYEHRCPGCGAKSYFNIPLITCFRTALFGFVLALCSCTDETNSRRALDNEGYTDVHFTGYQWMACSEDDSFHTGFTATNSKGKLVSGVVCCGWIKSCTIRY